MLTEKKERTANMEKPELTADEIKEIDEMIAYRKKMNMSQKAFAEVVGVSHTNIMYVEQKRQAISMSLRNKIAILKKEMKYHTASMDDFEEMMRQFYAGNEAAKRLIPLISEHISEISMAEGMSDYRKQSAYLNFLERTLAEYENVCKQVANQIKNEQKRDLTGSVTGLQKSIIEQQKSTVKQYER